MLKDHGTLIQIVLYLVVIISIWLAEFSVAIHSLKKKWQHTWVNLMFIGTALPIQLAMTLIVIFVSGWVSIHHWGILYLLPHSHSPWVKYVAGFFLMDFFEYIYHVIMHKAGPLWNFHLVHHTDIEMDVSTTVREHPGETFIRVCFQIIWVFLAGASIGLLLLRQTVRTDICQFNCTYLFSVTKENRKNMWVTIYYT
ncbi:sterol desaturase family protein [Pedobacter sp. NJ-S-72]